MSMCLICTTHSQHLLPNSYCQSEYRFNSFPGQHRHLSIYDIETRKFKPPAIGSCQCLCVRGGGEDYFPIKGLGFFSQSGKIQAVYLQTLKLNWNFQRHEGVQTDAKTFLERGMVFPGSTQFYDVEVKKLCRLQLYTSL